MINSKLNPVEWSSLLYELEDAKEHLESLISEMVTDGQINEVEYKVQISHVFSHLNRSWNSRNKIGKSTEKEHELYAKFPKDIEPCG